MFTMALGSSHLNASDNPLPLCTCCAGAPPSCGDPFGGGDTGGGGGTSGYSAIAIAITIATIGK